MPHRKKVGLALSSGAVRSFSQVGVLKALEEAGIKIDMIAGSSGGAMIASAYAVGRSISDIEKIALSIPWARMFDFHVSRKSLIKGKNWQKFIDIFTMGKSFKDAKIPLYIMTVNTTKQKKQVFTSGDLQKTVMASASIPGIVPPVILDNEVYVDGGVIDPIPFDILREKGCDVIIAVDISEKSGLIRTGDQFMRKTSPVHDFERILLHDDMATLFEFIDKNRIFPKRLAKKLDRLVQKIIEWTLTPARALTRASGRPSYGVIATMYDAYDMLQKELLRERVKNNPDVIFIKPNLGTISKKDFWDTALYIQKGEAATKKMIPEIKKKIGTRK